ncbi:MAG: BACON domain-containing protein, partial [Candidatus Cryptobacteroides sp.]
MYKLLIFAALLMSVSCSNIQQDILSIDRSELQFESSPSGEQQLELSANRSWEAVCDASWVTVDPSSGNGGSTVRISVDENVGAEGSAAAARTAKVMFNAGGSSAVLAVGQDAEPVAFTVEGSTSLDAAGGPLVFKVERNTSYSLDIQADWIRRADTKAVLGEYLRLEAEPNESAQSRSANLVFSPQGAASRTVTVKQEGIRQNGIATAADFLSFAEAVNSSLPLERFCNEAGEVILLDDIDLKGCELVPVGMPVKISNSNTSMTYEGPSFKGVFNGQGHCISNITLDKKVAAESTYGIFGVLDGGTVKNLVLGREGDESVARVFAAAQADAAILVGSACNGATVENCVNNVPLEIRGTESDSKRFSCGVFVGYACSTDKAVSLNSLVNNAPVKASSGANTASTASGVMAGGIAGFCTGSGTAVTMVENCVNNGNIEAKCGRSSGIVATMNAKTMMR